MVDVPAGSNASDSRHGGKLSHKMTFVNRKRFASPLFSLHSVSHGLLELSTIPPGVASSLSSRPVAFRCAVFQSRESAAITNLRHQTVVLSELERWLLQRCDGSFTIEQIIGSSRDVPTMSGRSSSQGPVDHATVREALMRLHRWSLLEK